MQRIFTLCAFFLLFILTGKNLVAQCLQQGITEDFSQGAAGFTSNFLSYENEALTERTNQGRTYVITSNQFVVSNQTTAAIRFTFTAEGTAGTPTAQIKDVNSATSVAGVTTLNAGVYCITFNTSTLQDRTVRFIISVSVSNTGQRRSTFDNFGSSLPELITSPP